MITVHPGSNDLAHVAKEVATAHNIVALTGAGISTAAGILDYHSKGGRYAKGNPFLQSAFFTEEGRRKFMEHAIALRDAALRSEPTKTHMFLLQLQQVGKLLRLYTQNVDGLEAAAGLHTNTTTGISCSPTCILLHGNIRILKCKLCCTVYEWQDRGQEGVDASQDAGTEFSCRHCQEKCKARVDSGKRRITIGQLYPDIICSDEEHPQGAEIQSLIERDERRADMVIILGTSLKVGGPMKLAKQLAGMVHSRGGIVVYVSRTEPTSHAARFVDYWIKWECDSWAEDLWPRI